MATTVYSADGSVFNVMHPTEAEVRADLPRRMDEVDPTDHRAITRALILDRWVRSAHSTPDGYSADLVNGYVVEATVERVRGDHHGDPEQTVWHVRLFDCTGGKVLLGHDRCTTALEALGVFCIMMEAD